MYCLVFHSVQRITRQVIGNQVIILHKLPFSEQCRVLPTINKIAAELVCDVTCVKTTAIFLCKHKARFDQQLNNFLISHGF